MIVEASPQDGPQVREVTARTGMFNDEEVQCVDDIFQQQMQLGQEASGYTFFVEKEGERVLGFVCLGPRALADRVFDLYWIVVDPTAHRQGIGRRLIEKAETVVRQRGGRILVIETSGTQKYAGTRAFYQASGYLHEATLRDLYADGDDLCIFTKRINPV